MGPKQIQNPVLGAIRTIFGLKGTDNVQAVDLGAAAPVYDILPTSAMASTGLADDGFGLWTVSDLYSDDGDNNTDIYNRYAVQNPGFSPDHHVLWAMGPLFASAVGLTTDLEAFAVGLANVLQAVGPGATTPPAMLIFLAGPSAIDNDIGNDVVWTGGAAGRPLGNWKDVGQAGTVRGVNSPIRYPLRLRQGATLYRNMQMIAVPTTDLTINMAFPVWAGVKGAIPPLT